MLGKAKRNLSPEEKRFFYLCAVTVALLFSSVVPQCSFARTWYVKADGTGNAPTIQAGVDSAAVGDTVMVGVGAWDVTRGDQTCPTFGAHPLTVHSLLVGSVHGAILEVTSEIAKLAPRLLSKG